MTIKPYITIRRMPLSHSLYIILLCICTFSRLLGSTNISKIGPIQVSMFNSLSTRLCMFGFFAVFCLFCKMSKAKIAFIITAGALVLLVIYMSNYMGCALVFLAIIAYPSGLKTEDIMRWISRLIFSYIIVIFILSNVGVISSQAMFRNGNERHSFGFIAANSLANSFLIGLIAYMYSKGESWTLVNTFFCAAAVLAVFIATNSRMAFFISLILLIVRQLWRSLKTRKHGIIYYLSAFCYPAFTLLCLGLTIIHSKGLYHSVLSKLNEFMSYRLGFMSGYYTEYGINLFGQSIKTVSRAEALETGAAWRGLDNSYMYVLICWGAVLTLVLCFLYFRLGLYLKYSRNYIGALCVFCLCLVGITENLLSSIGYNLAIILMAEMIADKSAFRRKPVKNNNNSVEKRQL